MSEKPAPAACRPSAPTVPPEAQRAHALGSRRVAAAALTVIAGFVLASGCGGSSQKADGQIPGDIAGPATVESAEAELGRAEAALQGMFGGSSDGSSADVRPAQPSPPPTTSAEALTNPAGSRCETACDALASMGRSATRVCELAGPGERCDAAKARVTKATARVTAQCSECES